MKALLVLGVLCILLFTESAYAAPVGNPTLPKTLKSVFLGKEQKPAIVGLLFCPEVDITFDRNIEKQTEDTEFKFYGGRAGAVIADRVFLYGIAGYANADQQFKLTGTKNVQWETETDFAWGAGGTLVLYEKEIEVRENAILRVGVDCRYRQIDLNVDKITVRTLDSCGNTISKTEYKMPDTNVWDYGFSIGEWQAAAGVSCQFGRFIPYAGCKYSDFNGEAKATINKTEYKVVYNTENKVGFFAGLDLLVTDSISVSAEGRFVDELALSANAAIRF